MAEQTNFWLHSRTNRPETLVQERSTGCLARMILRGVSLGPVPDHQRTCQLPRPKELAPPLRQSRRLIPESFQQTTKMPWTAFCALAVPITQTARLLARLC